MENVKEIEAYNASRVSAKSKDHGKITASTQKERRAKCYMCRDRGRVLWTCKNRKKIAMVELKDEILETINKDDAEKAKYPEKVHVTTNYMIDGTYNAT